MKIAVLGDIHANWPALQTVAAHIDAWQPEHVYVLGDVVNRGPRPEECLQFILARETGLGWQTVRGNHEDYVLSVGAPDAVREGPVYQITRHSHWTRSRIAERLPSILAWPFARHARFGPQRNTLQVVHASLVGNRAGVYVRSSDEEIAAQAGSPPPDLLVCGHTHRAMTRRVEAMAVVNAGSAGLPFDGDWRPAYAQLTLNRSKWTTTIVRLAYDRDAAERDFALTGCLDEGGPLVPLMVAELRVARSHIAEWQRQWERAVLAGEITAEESVKRFLESR